ncbi:substrate-binding periplasmic protein [Ectopseudomonas toyotomiensis]|uniref:Transporter substrate-binding domain-containing protein n=1 Tax=Ectopseudomonas toyotomiensis TaxID=554344 RepID=A0AA42LLV2_9GAMM|nr:transporter substrate-binding domain-containing protein [Pseudomonas toyotomiensis]MBG0842408.1 transporter substrate-binding domain-containing protein [Pseudomonas toyotomiensis]MDH0703068.1 transporter substrate-binding domain-containing protein [Pseudomonas toyotomiensis]
MHKALHYCLLWLLAGNCYGSQPTLTFCHEDQNAYPWVMTDGTGLNLELLDLVQQALKLQVIYVAVPWKRCLSGMQQGLYDGAFAASFKTERLQMGRYPSDADGRPDAFRRLHTSRYTLYRRIGSAVSWDGQRFTHVTGRVGSLSGFSIRDLLLAHGLEVDESSRDPLALLQMLVHGRVDAVALQTMRGDFILQANPQLARQVEKLPQLLEEKPYYLMLSNALLARDPELAERIWSEVQRQRESATYQARVEAYLAQPGH